MTYSRAGDDLIIIDHTEVPAALRGRKVGGTLIYRPQLPKWSTAWSQATDGGTANSSYSVILAENPMSGLSAFRWQTSAVILTSRGAIDVEDQ